jgi:hypothetical protein
MTDALPEQKNAITALVKAPAPTEVKDVVTRLKDLQAEMERFNGRSDNPVASFNQLYTTITREVDQHLTETKFQDPDFMTTLDLRFAERYFSALQQWNDRSAWAPRCWSALFNRWNDDDMAPILGAVAGVTAHIQFDLGAALVQTFREIGGPVLDDSSARKADYDILNDIFAEKIPTLRRGFLEGNLFADWFDRLTGTLDDVFQSASIEAARASSWKTAKQLWQLRDDPDAYSAQVRSLDGLTEGIIGGLFFFLDNPLGNRALGSN